MSDAIGHLLQDIFNHDFSASGNSGRNTDEFHNAFFGKHLSLPDLKKINQAVTAQSYTAGKKTIPAAMLIPGKKKAAPHAILAQLHGNEPAGLGGIALAMALSVAGQLEQDVVCVIGNPLAADQYFKAWELNPIARQETRDAYRCGLDKDGNLLPDGNRIPTDFLDRKPDNPHIKRAQELWELGQHIEGIADLHSARGNMICVTDYKYESDLKHSPIRAVLTELAEAISANASTTVTVKTLKTILSPLPHIKSQIGIEAGTHEAPAAPGIAAAFTLSWLHNLGLTKIKPLLTNESGLFARFSVRPRITYADLPHENTLQPGDKIHMARQAKPGDKILISGYTEHQYEEMEAIKKGQVVAVAVPSGTVFRAPSDFSTLFISKPAKLYDKDPAVGPWPVEANKLADIKFCYPCAVSQWKIVFKQ